MDILPDDGRRLNAVDGSGQVVGPAPEQTQEAPAPPEQPRPIRLHVTQERAEQLNWGLSRRAQRGDLHAMTLLVAHFMFSGASYLDKDEAVERLDELSRRQMLDLVDELMDRMEGVAVGGDPK